LITDTCPLIVHAPGKLKHDEYCRQNPLWQPGPDDWSVLWEPLHSSLFSSRFKECSLPTELAIATWNNKPTSPCELSLERLGLKVEVLGRGIKHWKNTMKMELAAEYLSSVEEPYTLLLDSSDVLVLRCLNELVDHFLNFKCDALFNAEKTFWPDEVEGIIKKWKHSQGHGHVYNYLNAGVVIGKTQFLADYYKSVNTLDVKKLISQKQLIPTCELTEQSIIESEQIRHHWGYYKFKDQIKLDHQAKVFQSIVFHSPLEIVWGSRFL